MTPNTACTRRRYWIVERRWLMRCREPDTGRAITDAEEELHHEVTRRVYIETSDVSSWRTQMNDEHARNGAWHDPIVAKVRLVRPELFTASGNDIREFRRRVRAQLPDMWS